METDLLEAASRFRDAMTHCDNLVTLHRDHGGPAQGRRDEEVSVNRAVIVITVAAWQAAVQEMALSALDAGEPGPGSPISPATYGILAGVIRQQVSDFSTPNPENSRRLLVGVGFDPRSHWTWRQRGGRGLGVITVTPAEAETRMREWLRLRHDIAHGHDRMSRVSVLQAVRDARSRSPQWSPQVRLVDAEACMAFFRRICQLTGDALARHLGQDSTAWH